MSALYLCILMRIMIVHHGMFAINSVAHTWGERTYRRELTAVDNWIMAFITLEKDSAIIITPSQTTTAMV